MNHCLLEVDVVELPQVRYTQDNQTPVAEMLVSFDGLRPDDPPGQLKVVGWGTLAQDLQNRVQVGQKLVIEGRMRMNTVTRQDGVKEKKAEFTLARLHPIGAGGPAFSGTGGAPAATPAAVPSGAPGPAAGTRPAAPKPAPRPVPAATALAPTTPTAPAAPTWNTSPLVPDLPDGDDDIPF